MTRRARLSRATWLSLLVAVLVLVLVGFLDGLIERRMGEAAPEIFDDVRVRLGETATIDGVRITLDRMESAYQLTGGGVGSGMRDARTSGLFLVFTVRAEAVSGSRTLSLEGDLSYAGVRTGLRDVLVSADPGTVEVGAPYLEVDPQALRESAGRPVQLRLWHNQLTYQYRTRVVVDLAMDQQRVDALLGVPPSTTLNLPRPTPRGLR